MCSRLSVGAAAAMTRRPVSLEPVSVTIATPGCATSASPASDPPVTAVTSPSGAPASASSETIRCVERGVCGAGLMTTPQPAASGAASFQTAMISGKFHGAMAPTTPTGRRWTTEV